MSFADMTIRGFLDELASSSPAPGGGSASAVAGAMGVGLAAMVAGLTDTCKMSAEDASRVDEIKQRSKGLIQGLLGCADDDTAAFNDVMKAFRLPKQTDEEKRARREAIQMALKGAADAPHRTLQLAAEGMEMAACMAELGNDNAASDAGVGTLLLDTAMGGAIFNMQINLASIKDQDFVAEMRSEIDRFTRVRDELRQRAVCSVTRRIGS
ncbi:MAG: cyclodeaminase/cyclohydrolase family protein [Bacillota bacterium]|jgi:formiminotetrahydrofolate cyclodeaminase